MKVDTHLQDTRLATLVGLDICNQASVPRIRDRCRYNFAERRTKKQPRNFLLGFPIVGMTLLSPLLRLSLSLLGLILVVAIASTPVSSTELEQEIPVALPSSVEAAAALASLTQSKELTPTEAELELLSRLLENNNVGKRAYSYVSEYKRLPVYNFGLGKRSQSQLYSFGLGKRTPGGRTYSFGLGKRAEDNSDGASLPYDHDDVEYVEEIGDSNEIDTLWPEDEMMEKRNKLYSFGLGKRVKPYGFGLGKRYPGDADRLYSFGLGKRTRPEMYSFGLGKRGGASRQYSFGLGKRPSQNQNSRFNFGLGKRSFDEDVDELMENVKRASADRRFSFGLGKRDVSESELKEANEEGHVIAKRSDGQNEREVTEPQTPYGFGLGKRDVSEYELKEVDAESNQGHVLAKRSPNYGKEDGKNGQENKLVYKRSPYGSGTGKRSDG